MMPTLAEAIGGKHRVVGGPFGSKLTQRDYCATGVPVIRGSNMPDAGRRVRGPYVHVSVEKFDRDLASNAALPGDIIVTQRGTLGQVGIIDPAASYKRFVVSQSQMAIRVNEDMASRDFVYYFLTSPQFNAYIANSTIQTGVPHINLGVLRDAPVKWPKLEDQIEIASTLVALDDKIELNRQMNETLEAIARATFHDWFVDFGPVRAKMEGRTPYLEEAVWRLFPERLDEEGKPVGWVNSTIGQEVDVVGGSTPSTKESAFWGGDIAWVTPKDLSYLTSPVLLGTERRITDSGLAQISSGLLPVGTVLLSSRAPIGYVAIAQMPIAVNQGFIAMICERRLSNIYVWLWTQANMEAVHQNANGSTFQEISKANFRPIGVRIAASKILQAFDDSVRPLFERIVANERESRALAETRDFLLPKLVSGEVRFADAASLA